MNPGKKSAFGLPAGILTGVAGTILLVMLSFGFFGLGAETTGVFTGLSAGILVAILISCFFRARAGMKRGGLAGVLKVLLMAVAGVLSFYLSRAIGMSDSVREAAEAIDYGKGVFAEAIETCMEGYDVFFTECLVSALVFGSCFFVLDKLMLIPFHFLTKLLPKEKGQESLKKLDGVLWGILAALLSAVIYASAIGGLWAVGDRIWNVAKEDGVEELWNTAAPYVYFFEKESEEDPEEGSSADESGSALLKLLNLTMADLRDPTEELAAVEEIDQVCQGEDPVLAVLGASGGNALFQGLTTMPLTIQDQKGNAQTRQAVFSEEAVDCASLLLDTLEPVVDLLNAAVTADLNDDTAIQVLTDSILGVVLVMKIGNIKSLGSLVSGLLENSSFSSQTGVVSVLGDTLTEMTTLETGSEELEDMARILARFIESPAKLQKLSDLEKELYEKQLIRDAASKDEIVTVLKNHENDLASILTTQEEEENMAEWIREVAQEEGTDPDALSVIAGSFGLEVQ